MPVTGSLVFKPLGSAQGSSKRRTPHCAPAKSDWFEHPNRNCRLTSKDVRWRGAREPESVSVHHTEGTGSVNLVANADSRTKFLARFMVAPTDRHKISRRKGRHRASRILGAQAHAPPKRTPTRAPVTPEELPHDQQEPEAEEPNKRKAGQPEGVEAAATLAKAQPVAKAEPEESSSARGRERAAYDGDTAIKLYLREIGQVKPLTTQEEIELAARIQKGDKKAREQMIKANLRLVVKIAHDYEGLGLPLLDLISEGNIGLMKAVERFDPAKGGKLSTYGAWWIKQSMKRALANQSKTIRLPVHMVDKISKMNRAARRLQELLGREPTDEELAEELGIKTARVAMMRMAATRPTSLDAPVGDADNGTFAEVVRDENADDPFEELQAKGVTGMLKDLVTNLTEREANILRARYGLDGGR